MDADQKIDFNEITIGEFADYLDTGLWSLKDGNVIAPDDLTIGQLKDFLRVSGGAVYLRKDNKLGWATIR